MTGLPDSNPRKRSMTGKLVAAHPSRVAQADQVAADQGIKRVRLSALMPTSHVYVIDADELYREQR